MRYLILGLLIIATQFLLSSGCNKNKTRPCLFGGYSFAATSAWSPQTEVYNIGDTLVFYSSFPKILVDQVNPSLTIDYSNSVGIGGDISIYYLDTLTHQPIPGRDSFSLISLVGNFAERSFNQSSGINFLYNELSQIYEFKGKVICRKKGIYGFGVSDLKSRGIKGKNCTNAGFAMTVTNSDKHLELYERAINITLDDYASRIGYVFRVQ